MVVSLRANAIVIVCAVASIALVTVQIKVLRFLLRCSCLRFSEGSFHMSSKLFFH